MSTGRLRNSSDSFEGKQAIGASFCLCGGIGKSSFLYITMKECRQKVAHHLEKKEIDHLKDFVDRHKGNVSTWNKAHSRQI